MIKQPYYRNTIIFTIFQAFLSALVSVIIAIPGAFIISNREIKFRKLVNCIYYLPFVLPSILLVLGFVIFYGNNGYLNNILYRFFGIRVKFLYSFKTIIMAHVFYNLPIAISFIGNSWLKIDPQIVDAAKSDGASSFRILRKITLPFLQPAIASAFSLIFLYCLNSFAIILVLGGNIKYTTTEVEIYRQAKINLNITNAVSISVISLIFAIIALLVNSVFDNRTDSENAVYSNRKLKRTSFAEKTYLVITCLFLSSPLMSIILRCFRADSLSISKNLTPLFNSFLLGLSSATLGTIMGLGICLSRKNNFNIIGMLPLAVSSVIIGLSYIIVGRFLTGIPDFIILTLAHSVIVTPFVVKSLLPHIRSIPKDLLNSSYTDGASQFKAFRYIEIPYIRKSLRTAFLFSFAISCGELNSTLLLGGNFNTIPVAIYRMVSSYDYDNACVMGTFLLLICIIVYCSDINQNSDF